MVSNNTWYLAQNKLRNELVFSNFGEQLNLYKVPIAVTEVKVHLHVRFQTPVSH
jgi:hypothetical protein